MDDVRFTNSEGRSFTVRVVMPGDAYGRNGCLTLHDDDGPMVEFYDATYANDPKAAEADSFAAGRGQFVSRYFVNTLEERQEGVGLDLMGYVDVWKIDGNTMDQVMAWLAQEVSA